MRLFPESEHWVCTTLINPITNEIRFNIINAVNTFLYDGINKYLNAWTFDEFVHLLNGVLSGNPDETEELVLLRDKFINSNIYRFTGVPYINNSDLCGLLLIMKKIKDDNLTTCDNPLNFIEETLANLNPITRILDEDFGFYSSYFPRNFTIKEIEDDFFMSDYFDYFFEHLYDDDPEINIPDVLISLTSKKYPSFLLLNENFKRKIYLLINEDDISILIYEYQFKLDINFTKTLITHQPMALSFIADEWKKNREIVCLAVTNNGLALQFAADEFKSDSEIVCLAVTNDGLALQFAADELKSDRDIVRLAVSNDRKKIFTKKNEIIYDAFEYLFSDVSSKYKVRLATFLPNKEITLYEEHLLNKYKKPFPISFSGKIQSSYDEYDEYNFLLDQYEVSFEVDIDQANNLNEILTIYANNCEEFLITEGKNLRVNEIKYLSNERIVIFIREYEDDYIDYNTLFFNALIEDNYDVKFINNNFIRLENNFMRVIIEDFYEPELYIIKFISINNIDLNNQEIKSEVLKYYSELKSLGYYPSNSSINEFSLVGFESNDYGYFDDLNEHKKFCLLGLCLEKLYKLRKRITYPSTGENSVQNLFNVVNENEQYRFENNFEINDYAISSFENYLVEKEPSATYNGNDYHFMIINTNEICDIILWYFEKIDDKIIIEYSLRDLTQNLILDFK